MSNNINYVKELSNAFKRHITWEPLDKRNLGDIGVMEKGIFKHIDNIKSLGFELKEEDLEIDESENNWMEYSSDSCTEINLNVEASIPPNLIAAKGKGDFLISFAKEGGVYFKANEVKTHKIKHQLKLMSFILENFKAGKWKAEWVVITELKEASSGIALYSKNTNGQVILKGNGQVGTGKLEAANLKAGIDVVRADNMSLKIVAGDSFTPMFRLKGIRRKWRNLWRAEVGERSRRKLEKPSEIANVFEDIPIERSRTKQTSASTPSNKLYALLVGINQYQDLSNLVGCENDVEAVHDYLIEATNNKYDLQVKKLINQAATKSAIVEGLKSHFATATTDDVLLFYFSGHGAREVAPDFLKRIEKDTDGKMEVFCCHDSLYDEGATYLADKELRYLLHQLTNDQKPHTLVITDCCHSGSITRGMLSNRNIDETIPERSWDGFIFAQPNQLRLANFSNVNDLDQVLPIAKHLHIAACQKNQKAKEDRRERIGVFSNALLEVLKNTSGTCSYHKLLNDTRFLLAGTYEQTPVLWSRSDSDVVKAFLGGVSVNDPQKTTVKYDTQKRQWRIAQGALQGMSTDNEYPTSLTIINELGNTLAKMEVQKVLLNYAYGKVIEGDEYLDKTKHYEAQINGLYRPQIKVLCKGNPEKVAAAWNFYLRNEHHFKADNIVFCNANTAAIPDYYLLADEEGYQINKMVESAKDGEVQYHLKPIVAKEPYGESAMRMIHEYLEAIANWTFIKDLQNPSSTIPKSDIQLTVHQDNHVVSPDCNDTYLLSFTKKDHGEEKNNYTRLSFKIKNNSTQRYRISLLYMGQDFMIDNYLYASTGDSNSVSILEGGKPIWSNIKHKDATSNVIEFVLEDYIKKDHWKEETMYMKVIISTYDSPFSIHCFQKGLPHPYKGADRGGSRGGRIRNNENTESWLTKTICLKTKNPYYKETN